MRSEIVERVGGVAHPGCGRGVPRCLRWIPRALRARALASLVALGALGAGCAPGERARDLRDLVVVDSTYLAPETLEPFTGPVYRTFPDDPSRREIEGALLEGAFHGDLVVYHPSGRVRYAGSFDRGQRCGPWTENAFDRKHERPLQALRDEIEALGIYPPCQPE